MDSLVLEVLPAEEGDCLLLTCRAGDEAHHVLIDGGTPATAARLRARLERLPDRHLDLLVVTHIDTDHIGGMVRLLRDPDFDFAIEDVWFNGFKHLPRNRTAARGVADAERLSAILMGVSGGRALNWNSAFGHEAVMRAADDQQSAEDLPVIKFPWGLTVTMLSPSPKRLDALYTGWNRYLEELRQELPSPQTEQRTARPARGVTDLEELAMAPSAKDAAAANGSSIAFLAKFAGRSCIFAADAYANVLEPVLLRLARLRDGTPTDAQPPPISPLKVDVFKLPHHGSQANVLPELFKVVQADHYIVSTNGNRFNHPDDEAMARVITKGGADHTIWFNYRSARTDPWDRLEWQNKYRYVTKYPDSDGGGITLTLPSIK